MDMEKKSPLRDVMNSTMEKVREMVDANNIVGAPITTPDGVTLIPISRVSFGFGSGGGDYGKPGQNNFGGGGGAGVKIDPVAFLVIKDGTTRVMPVAVPPVSTVDRVVEDLASTVVLLRPEGALPEAPPLRMELEPQVWADLGAPSRLVASVAPEDILLFQDL